MSAKEESGKAGLKLNIQGMKFEWCKKKKKLNIQKADFIESSPITSWQIDGERKETVADFIFFDWKMTAAMKLKDTCSLEEKVWPT